MTGISYNQSEEFTFPVAANTYLLLLFIVFISHITQYNQSSCTLSCVKSSAKLKFLAFRTRDREVADT